MDSNRFFQLLLISAFSAAIALLGLNELSHRFIKSGAKDGEIPSAHELVKDLRGEVDIVRPLANRPTPEQTPATSGVSSTTDSAFGAARSNWNRLMDKLLPKEK
jgi:hypothetical protein